MRDLEDQIDVFPREMVLRRIDAERNMWRFYRLAVEPDLFGGASLVRQLGPDRQAGAAIERSTCRRGAGDQ